VTHTATFFARWVPAGIASGALPALVRRALTLPPDAAPARDRLDSGADLDQPAAGPAEPRAGESLGRAFARRWQMLALVAVLLLSAFLNLYLLNQ
jgi:hypothetical protein